MKSLLMSLFFLMSSLYASEIVELKGQYAFSNHTEVLSSKINEIVHARNQAGKDRLGTLINEGYDCKRFPRNTFRCHLFDHSVQPSERTQRRISTDLEKVNIVISNKTVSPETISKGESVELYRFNKEVILNGSVYPYYDYQITINRDYEIHKIKFFGNEFVVINENEIRLTKLVSEGMANGFKQFVVQGLFLN